MIKENPEANNIRYRLAFCHYLKAYLITKDLEKLEKTSSKKKSDLFISRLQLNDKNPEIKKNLDLSINYFNEILKLNPNDSWAKIYYAFILTEQFNEIEKARALWSEVLNQDPNNPAPHFFIGELHIKEGNLKEGILEISQAILLRSQGY
jgi:tetratricopeptide (TPR) repeat protein